MSFNRSSIVFGIVCTVLVVFCGLLFLGYARLSLGAADADYQTEIFDAMRTQALESTKPSDIAGSLDYAVNHYPSGTKHRKGSKLDRVVERHRSAVVREIVEHLRRITGQDFGDNAEPWIEKYAK